ncbi:hypothetical protein [Paraburkholderia panacisoli]|uniref:hypothetical protein n=1 Tax=Paraburkholderia panacisoli TaxID=2603818 RepID=UPI00165FEAF0|nr:hypothetical protein [Paraburkholderia panacisoli]
MYLALDDRERHVVKRPHSGEDLGDTIDLQQRFLVIHDSSRTIDVQRLPRTGSVHEIARIFRVLFASQPGLKRVGHVDPRCRGQMVPNTPIVLFTEIFTKFICIEFRVVLSICAYIY